MKKFVIIFLIIIPVLLQAGEITSFKDLLRSVKSQSMKYSNSLLHQQIKSSRDNREYEVGDQVTFWSWTLTVMPPTWILTPATCRAVGEHCYLFVEDDQWDIHMDQGDVDLVMLYLEEDRKTSKSPKKVTGFKKMIDIQIKIEKPMMTVSEV